MKAKAWVQWMTAALMAAAQFSQENGITSKGNNGILGFDYYTILYYIIYFIFYSILF